MPDFTRKLTIFGCLLFTGFCFWKEALGLVDVTDASVVSTAEAALSPSFSHKQGVTTPSRTCGQGCGLWDGIAASREAIEKVISNLLWLIIC